MASDERRSTFSTAVLFFGAAAGLTILVSLIGTLVSWARYYALDLPSHAASATLSQATVLLRGANALAGPITAGLVAAGLVLLLRWLASPPRHPGKTAAGACAALVLAVAAAAVLAPWSIAVYIALTGALVAASLVPWCRRLRAPVAAYTSFFIVLGIGVIFLIWGALRPPTYLERAELTFSNGAQPLHGFWIADSSTTIYVAPRVGGSDGPCQVTGEVLAFPREDVRSIRFGSAVAVWPQGRTPTPDACR